MTFIKQRNSEYELRRYATSAHVVGGFSKLLSYFKKTYEWNMLISFADLRWSNGNLYKQTGWKLDKILHPDYVYSPNAQNRVHKFNYRRKNLPNLLNEFNPELSERENCDNNNMLRIWDCGKLRYIIQNT